MLRLREEAPFTRSRAKSAQELSPLLIARFSLARLTVKRDGSMPTAARFGLRAEFCMGSGDTCGTRPRTELGYRVILDLSTSQQSPANIQSTAAVLLFISCSGEPRGISGPTTSVSERTYSQF